MLCDAQWKFNVEYANSFGNTQGDKLRQIIFMNTIFGNFCDNKLYLKHFAYVCSVSSVHH